MMPGRVNYDAIAPTYNRQFVEPRQSKIQHELINLVQVI